MSCPPVFLECLVTVIGTEKPKSWIAEELATRQKLDL
jgi:hypothetical protein